MNTALEVVERQLETYNARDIAGFAACFSDDIVVMDLDTNAVRTSGLGALREFYGAQFLRWPLQRSRVTNRQQVGEYVTDLEYITGVPDREPYFLLAIYRVRGGKIDRCWFTPRA